MNYNSPLNIRIALKDLVKLHRLQILIKKHHKDGLFYICNKHLGDTVIFCSIAKSLQKIDKREFTIIVEDRYRSVPEIFGLNSMTADLPKFRIPFVETLNFMYLSLFNLFSNRKFLLSFPGLFLYIKCSKKLLYSNMYTRYLVSLGVHLETPFSCIDDTFLLPPALIITNFKGFDLKIRRTVIISPDSLSMKKIDINFFIALYQSLEKLNYVPIINSNNNFWVDNGFRAFYPEILTLLYYSILAGYSVSARSGISDLLSFTPGVKNIIIYGDGVPDDFIIGKEKERLCSNIFEFYFTTEDNENLIKNIISSLGL